MADPSEGADNDAAQFGGTGAYDSVADASIAGAAPNAGMSVGQQYAEYGAGRTAAELAAGYGAGGNGYSATAGAVNQVQGQTIGQSLVSSAKTALSVVTAVLGLASPSPVGKVSGATTIASMFTGPASRSSNLGFTSVDGFGSAAPGLFTGRDDGGPDLGAGFGGSPVLGFNGAPLSSRTGLQRNPAGPVAPGALFGGLGLQPPGASRQVVTTGAATSAASPINPALVLVGLASLLTLS